MSLALSMAAYIYKDLPAPGPGERDIYIRLLTLAPGEKTGKISCTISHHPLESPPDYEAISYSWGHPNDTIQIMCEGKPITVPNNLNDFLLRTRAIGRERTLWIDSICINQNDPKEKNSQVAAMRHIYQKAKRTLIWLGKEYEESALGLKFAQELSDLYHKSPSKEKAEEAPKNPWYRLRAYEEFWTVFDPKWGAFFSLFDRPYWTRAWVVQEVAVSTEQWVICGDKAISWSAFFSSLLYIYSAAIWTAEFYGSKNMNQIVAMHLSQIEITQHWKPLHYKVLLRHRQALATDARDKIFAYYGISAHESLNDHEIKPDYTKNTSEIYTMIAALTLKGATDLDFLDIPRLSRDDTLGLPSWVPNWESNGFTPMFSLLQLEYIHSPGETPKNLYSTTKGSKYAPIIDKTLTQLELSGFEVDRIASVSSEWVIQDTTGYTSIAKQALVQQKIQGYIHEWETILGLASKASYPTGESRQEILWQTCIAGNFAAGKDETRKIYLNFEKRQYWLRFIQRLHLSGFILSWVIVVIIGHLLRVMGIPNPELQYRMLVVVMANRRAMETVGGYVGMVPKIAEVGDYIFLVKGGKLPLILRPKGRNWEFIGDCYVHGMMNGELWDEEEGKKSKCEKIVLV